MFVTVPEFEEITGISRHTIYSWIYRNKLPVGLEIAQIGLKTKVLKVKKNNEYYDQVLEYKEQERV